MAVAKVETSRSYIIKLTEDEARYLVGILQNPVSENDDSLCRGCIWDALISVDKDLIK